MRSIETIHGRSHTDRGSDRAWNTPSGRSSPTSSLAVTRVSSSATFNMPEESTVEDIVNAYTESWKLGLKAVAIYRDNSKRVQPLSSGSGKTEKKAAIAS